MHQEIMLMEKLVQEDFQWGVNFVSDMCEASDKDLERALTDLTYYDENT